MINKFHKQIYNKQHHPHQKIISEIRISDQKFYNKYIILPVVGISNLEIGKGRRNSNKSASKWRRDGEADEN